MGKRSLFRVLRASLAPLCIVLCAAFVAAGCGKFGTVYSGSSTTGTTSSTAKKAYSNKPFDAAARKAAGCGTITSQPDQGRVHTPDLTTSVKYTQNPPTSGEHWPPYPYKVPRPWGVYTSAQPDEAIVHNMEHGEIIIAYKGISKDEVNQLLALRKKKPYYLLIEPRPKNPKNGIYFLAWDHYLYCEHPSAPALQAFVDEFINQGPEAITNEPAKQS